MEFKGTKGKWHIENEKQFILILAENKNQIADIAVPVDYQDLYSRVESNANALLISKAPEMLEALLAVSEYESFGNHISEEVINKVNNIIKLATKID